MVVFIEPLLVKYIIEDEKAKLYAGNLLTQNCVLCHFSAGDRLDPGIRDRLKVVFLRRYKKLYM